jgi:hypothetical protein
MSRAIRGELHLEIIKLDLSGSALAQQKFARPQGLTAMEDHKGG